MFLEPEEYSVFKCVVGLKCSLKFRISCLLKLILQEDENEAERKHASQEPNMEQKNPKK